MPEVSVDHVHFGSVVTKVALAAPVGDAQASDSTVASGTDKEKRLELEGMVGSGVSNGVAKEGAISLPFRPA
jgi:hypothetical protein